MLNLTFLDLAREWKYCGFKEIEFELLPNSKVDVKQFVEYTEFLLERRTLEDAEGYMAAVLLVARIPNVVQYTLSGGRSEVLDRSYG